MQNQRIGKARKGDLVQTQYLKRKPGLVVLPDVFYARVVLELHITEITIRLSEQ
jgi:hypothetical protein